MSVTASDPTVASLVALVVEDEWLVRMEIADAFEEAGWRVIESSGGEAAVALLGANSRIDLLVTDIRLTGSLTGWDVAEAFRMRNPNGAVIYASATPATETRLVPGSVFVGKPCRADELTKIAFGLCGEARAS